MQTLMLYIVTYKINGMCETPKIASTFQRKLMNTLCKCNKLWVLAVGSDMFSKSYPTLTTYSLKRDKTIINIE